MSVCDAAWSCGKQCRNSTRVYVLLASTLPLLPHFLTATGDCSHSLCGWEFGTMIWSVTSCGCHCPLAVRAEAALFLLMLWGALGW